ncbi:fimbrial protein [Scandinavium goeteborgense]|uniref:Minor fimbrial subunit n=1 Tax=Scandinavium goeteborgense TaxID=1851514 RepID=A0A4R6EZK6_SCAGO|nr:fimbrial protein [Scandinavium goeteborgense]TDN64417.1 minor fimbrial subunit [Scandinavium goeteborgense]
MSDLMKKVLLLMVAGMMSSAVQATDLKISGTVVATPCTVDASSVSQDVDFGQVRLSEMRATGNASDWVPFKIKLVNCPQGTTVVTATFSGTPATADATLYANAGTAINAAVQLAQDANRTMVQGDGSSMTVPVDALHNATYALAGRLISFADTSSGSFRSVVQVNFTYQ